MSTFPRMLGPLEDHTNISEPASPVHSPKPAPPQEHKRLRRIRSFRTLQLNNDSSESFPSPLDSVFDAQLVLSEVSEFDDTNPHALASPLSEPSLSNSLPVSPIFANLDEVAELQSRRRISIRFSVDAQPSSRSKGSIIPIDARVKQAALRRTVSSTELKAGPTRYSSLISPQQSIHSIYPKCSTFSPCPLRKPVPSIDTNRRRSFSADDIACLPLASSATKRTKGVSDLSSSSVTSNERAALSTSSACFPHQPSYPLPEREPTPPGLPSFGSPEAVDLLAQQAQGVDRPPRVWLRQAGGLDLCTSSPRPNEQQRRVSLPAGFVARADDGTFVRGRFGSRVSGHGVGGGVGGAGRGLESHPWHRMAGLRESAAKSDEQGNNRGESADLPCQSHPDEAHVRRNVELGPGGAAQAGNLPRPLLPRDEVLNTGAGDEGYPGQGQRPVQAGGQTATSLQGQGDERSVFGTCWDFLGVVCCCLKEKETRTLRRERATDRPRSDRSSNASLGAGYLSPSTMLTTLGAADAATRPACRLG